MKGNDESAPTPARRRRVSLTGRITIVVIGLLTAIECGQVYRECHRRFMREKYTVDGDIRKIASAYKTEMLAAVTAGDDYRLNMVLQAICRHPLVLEVRVTNAAGGIATVTDDRDDARMTRWLAVFAHTYDHHFTLRHVGGSDPPAVGRFVLSTNRGLIFDRIRQDLSATIALSIVKVGLVGLALLMVIKRLVSLPVQRANSMVTDLVADPARRDCMRAADDAGELDVLHRRIDFLTRDMDSPIIQWRYTETAINAMIDTLIVVDNKDRIRRVNRATLELLGYAEQEIVGKHITKIIDNSVLQKTETIKTPIIEDSPADIRLAYIAADRKRIPMSISWNEILDEQKKLCGTVWVGRDATELEKNEKAMRSAAEDLERRVRTRTMELSRSNEKLRQEIDVRQRMEQELARNRDELQMIIDAMPAMLLYKDTENRIIRVNRAVSLRHGVNPEDMAGTETAKWYPDEAKKYYSEDLEVIRTGSPMLGCIECLGMESAERRWIQADKYPHRDQTGKIIGIIVLIQDVTEAKQSEEERIIRLRYESAIASCSRILLSQTGFKSVIAASLEALLEASAVSRVYVFENFDDEDLRLCARQIAETCAQGIKTMKHDPLLQKLPYAELSELWRENLSQGERYSGIVRWMPEADQAVLTPRQIQSILVFPINVEGTWHGFIGFDDCLHEREWDEYQVMLLRTAADMIGLFLQRRRAEAALRRAHDTLEEQVRVRTSELTLANYELQQQVSERVAAEERFRESLEELEKANLFLNEANKHKNRFLSSMSHELRTPLNAILGFTDLLAGQFYGLLNQTQESYVDRIEKNGQHLLELISDLLDLARIDAGAMEIEIEEFPPGLVVNQSVSMLSSQFRKKQLKVETDIDPQLTSITADRRKFNQIMLNLLSNAVKYTPECGSIRVVAALNGSGQVRVAVSDTGIGIEASEHAKIFSEFHQADRIRDEQLGGTGIGLALTKRLVQMHGGAIGVSSTLGDGSTFWFTLPISTPANKATDQGPKSDRFRLMPSRRILVAEDNETNLAMLLEMLSIHKHKVIVARNGQEVVELAKPNKPDLILMDISMPVMDGLEATRILRSLPDFSDIPIIALTANAGNEFKQTCLDAGCNEHVAKPIQSKQLFKLLKKYIGASGAG